MATTATRPNGVQFLSALLLVTAAGCGFEAGPVRTSSTGVAVSPVGIRVEPDPLPVSDNPAEQETGDLACAGTTTPTESHRVEMWGLLNEYRQHHNADPLTYSVTLQNAADAYALRMYHEGFFDHVAPDGSQPADRALAAGFCHGYVGENLAYGLNALDTADQTMSEFEASAGHNENMLYPAWRYIGIGFLHVTTDQGDEFWWVQLLAQEVVPP